MSTGYAPVLPLEDESEIRDVLVTLVEHARAIVSASYAAVEIGVPDEPPMVRRTSGSRAPGAFTSVAAIVLDEKEIGRCVVARVRPFTMAEQTALVEAVKRFGPIAGRIHAVAARNAERAPRAKHLALDVERPRREWTAIVAHDLRQPTGAISVFARILAGRIGPCSELSHIDVACRRLERQIDDLLDASAIETEQLKLELEDVDIRELVEGSLERIAVTARDLTVSLRMPQSAPKVRIDPLRIEQVLENLILNARKYRDPNTPVEISAEVRGDHVEIAVTNRGQGIAAAELPHIFDRFRRAARARASSQKGLGLGLYIVHGLVTAHGGQVSVESTPGESTTFRFTLRAARGDDDVAYPRCG